MSSALDHVRYSCGIAGEEVANLFDELRAENNRLAAKLEMAEACLAGDNALIAGLKAELEESRANDRTAMGYLTAIREALRFDGDFPALVEYCKALRSASSEPVGVVKKHTGSLKDMAIIVWTGEQPPEGAKLYVHPAQSDKPIECANGCPPQQVCDYCQGTGGKDVSQSDKDAWNDALDLADDIVWRYYSEGVEAISAELLKRTKKLDTAIDAAMQGETK